MGSQNGWVSQFRLTGYLRLLLYARGHDVAYDVSISLQKEAIKKIPLCTNRIDHDVRFTRWS